ncbi:hypothetical protein AAC387_Pa05g0067 [Persea americana]
MSTQKTIKQVVFFKLKPDTSSKIDSMISNLRSLVSLPPILHLTAGHIHPNRSSSCNFTHLLHSRYRTKEDLAAYSSHPSHLDAVNTSVLPICDDIMAVDWIADLHSPIVTRPNDAMRKDERRGHSSACCKNKNRRRIAALLKLGGVEKESENRCPVAGEANQRRRRLWPNRRRRRRRGKAAIAESVAEPRQTKEGGSGCRRLRRGFQIQVWLPESTPEK